MLTLKEWMELVDCRITEGSDYYSNIPGLYSLTSWNGEQDGYSLNIVFDPKDEQRVYCVEICDYANDRAYRIYDPELNVDKQAWDDVNFIELESDDDFIQKAQSIIAGEEYDERVSVPLDLDRDELFELMALAHEKDMTLNELVEEALRNFVNEYENDPEGFKARFGSKD